MFKKALLPVLLILAATLALAGIMYGCMATDLEHKLLGPERHHH
jgi:hypothetical protein